MYERRGVMACSSGIYENMEFYETWTKIRQKYDKIKYEKIWYFYEKVFWDLKIIPRCQL